MLYSNSDPRLKLNAVQTYLRYLRNTMNEEQEIPIGISLPMLNQLDEIDEQIRILRGIATRSAYIEMLDKEVDYVETPEWKAELLTSPSVTKIRSQEVAEALLSKIQAAEIKRNRNVPEQVIKSITAAAFWGVVDSVSLKWSKTKLKRKGILLEDFSEEGAPQNKVQVTKKS